MAVEAIDIVRFERSVGREIEPVRQGYKCDRARLLIALQYGLDPAEIAGGAQDATFIATIAGEDPEAILPGIVDDVMDMADRAPRKGVGDGPGGSRIGGCIDVDFVARGIVEVLSPKNCAGRNRGDVQRSRAASDRMVAQNLLSPARSVTIDLATAATIPPEGKTASE